MTWGWTQREATMSDIYKQVGQGWSKILESLIEDLFKLGWDGTVFQVKEKFGNLRFYTGTGNKEIFERIQQAGIESEKTCEYCGKSGKPRTDRSWIKTLCDSCNAKDKE